MQSRDGARSRVGCSPGMSPLRQTRDRVIEGSAAPAACLRGILVTRRGGETCGAVLVTIEGDVRDAVSALAVRRGTRSVPRLRRCHAAGAAASARRFFPDARSQPVRWPRYATLRLHPQP